MNAASRAFAINTYSYTLEWNVVDCIHHLAAQGYKTLELMMYPGHLWPAEADKSVIGGVRQACQIHGLRIVAVNMPNIDLNIAAANPEMRAYSLSALTNFIHLGGEIGATNIIVGPGKANPLLSMPTEQLISHFYRALDQLYPVAQAAGLKILVENMPFCFIANAHAIMDALDKYGNPDIGTIYDVANAYFIAEDIGEGLRSMKPRLELVHLSDTSRTVYRHDPVGYGDLPFKSVPPLLTEINYTEVPVLEIIAANPDNNIRESIEILSQLGFNNRCSDNPKRA